MIGRKLGEITKFLLSITIICAVVFGGYKLYQAYATGKDDSPNPEVTDYPLDDNTNVHVEEVLLGKASRLKSIEVYRREVSQKRDIEQKVFNINALSKSQAITYFGESVWTVNLEELDKKDIKVDKIKKTISIETPLPEVKIYLDSSKTKIGAVQKKWYVLGTIKTEVKNNKQMENHALKAMYAKLEKIDEISEAKAGAVETMKEIFKPVIESIGSEYEIEIVFKES